MTRRFTGYIPFVFLVAFLAFAAAAPAARAETAKLLPLTTITEISRAIEMQANLPRAAGLDPALRSRIRSLIDASLDEMRDVAGDDFEEFGDEDFWRAYTMSLSWEEHFVSPRFVSLMETRYEFTGGAHGNSTLSSLLWNLETHGEVSLAELFAPGGGREQALQAIASHLREELVRQQVERFDIELEEARSNPALEELRGNLEVLSNFTLMPSEVGGKSGGILFHFAPYMLGSYAEGSYHLAVPFAVFERYLASSFEQVFGGEPINLQNIAYYRAPGINILLYEPLPSDKLLSPLALTGEAPNFWFENGEARVELRGDNNNLIGEGKLTALPKAGLSGAASGMIRFSGELVFKTSKEESFGKLIFLRGDGTGGEAGGGRVELWVSF